MSGFGMVSKIRSVARIERVTDELHQTSSEDLVLQIQNGSAVAMEELFERHFRLVLSIAFRFLNDDAEAEDLMQEVFFEMFRTVHKFDRNRGTAKMWIMQLAYYGAMKRLRLLRNRERLWNTKVPVLPTETNEDPETKTMANRALDYLSRLSPRQRQVIELYYLQGMSEREIRAHTKIPHATVHREIVAAMKRLRRKFAVTLP